MDTTTTYRIVEPMASVAFTASSVAYWTAYGETIADGEARTIASYWHAPGSTFSQLSHGLEFDVDDARETVAAQRAELVADGVTLDSVQPSPLGGWTADDLEEIDARGRQCRPRTCDARRCLDGSRRRGRGMSTRSPSMASSPLTCGGSRWRATARCGRLWTLSARPRGSGSARSTTDAADRLERQSCRKVDRLETQGLQWSHTTTTERKARQ